MRNVYRFAGKKVGIQSIYPDVHEYCREYLSQGNTDLEIRIEESDIDNEEKISVCNAIHERRKPVSYSRNYLEELAVYRKIAEWMPSQGTILFHGSAIAVDREGYLFTAKSGTGKSTHAKLWREMLGDQAVMINDDKPLIHVKRDGGATIYGTPWDGKHRLSHNISVPLKAICYLKRGKYNRITETTKAEIYPVLVQQMYRPADSDKLMRSLELLDRLKVSFYELECNMEPEAAEVSFQMMHG